MAEHPHNRIARRFWAAVAEGDAESIRDVLADNVSWRSFGRNPLSGEHKGPDAVLDYLARIGEATEELTLTLKGLFAGDDGAVLTYHARGKRSGRMLDMEYVVVLQIDKGRIRAAASVPFDQHDNDRFWN